MISVDVFLLGRQWAHRSIPEARKLHQVAVLVYLIDVCNIQEVKFGLLDLVSWSLGQSSITKRGSVTMQGVVEFGGLRLSGDGSWWWC